MKNTLQSDYIFDDELTVEDEAHECIDGYLWATDRLVSALKEQIQSRYTEEELGSLENINFFGIFNMANGNVDLISNYYYTKLENGVETEAHDFCQLPVSDAQAEELKSELRKYCSERYHMGPLSFVNEARTHEGLPALPRPAAFFDHIKPSLSEQIRSAMSRLPEKGAGEGHEMELPAR